MFREEQINVLFTQRYFSGDTDPARSRSYIFSILFVTMGHRGNVAIMIEEKYPMKYRPNAPDASHLDVNWELLNVD